MVSCDCPTHVTGDWLCRSECAKNEPRCTDTLASHEGGLVKFRVVGVRFGSDHSLSGAEISFEWYHPRSRRQTTGQVRVRGAHPACSQTRSQNRHHPSSSTNGIQTRKRERGSDAPQPSSTTRCVSNVTTTQPDTAEEASSGAGT
jgi:hypothetical protein